MLRRWMKLLRGGEESVARAPVGEEAEVEELSRRELPFRWGPYTLLKHLGTGSLGETFIARQPGEGGASAPQASDEEIAKDLLVVRRGLIPISSSPYLQLFLSELNLYQQLVHPQVCRLKFAGDQEGIPIIVSEYAMGKSLLHLLGKSRVNKQPMPWQIPVYIVHELCAVLEYLHGKTDAEGHSWNMVVFRGGFSTADVLVSYSGEIRLADIGIRPICQNQARPMLPEGWAVLDHTPFYLSPEAVGGEVLSQASDIFCVGWLLWELATAGWLFAGANDFEKLTKIRDAKVQPPREPNPNIPAPEEAITLQALARSPADRIPSAKEMKLQLAQTADLRSARAELASLMKSIFADDLTATREELLRWTRS
jgi:serine/threonine protein kinase